MAIRQYLPQRISSSLVLVVVSVLLINALVSAFIISAMMTLAMLETSRQFTLPQLERSYKQIEKASVAERPALARSLSNELLTIRIYDQKPDPHMLPEPMYGHGPETVRKTTIDDIAKRMGISPAGIVVEVHRPSGVPFRAMYWGLNPLDMLFLKSGFSTETAHARDWLFADMQLSNGQWIHSVSRAPERIRVWAWPSLALLLLSSVLTLVLLAVIIRRITDPMRQLAEAANRLGRGEEVNELDEQAGPVEVRDMARAFNRMQTRLSQFIIDRMRMLAAVSHDLRTPITSLRINTEFIDDPEAKQRIENVLDDMQEIVESTLAFARTEETVEAVAETDLTQMIESICGEFRQQGKDASLSKIHPVIYRCKPVALKRALRNLVENAIKYGDKAKVDIDDGGSQLIISIVDAGPGLDPANVEFVFRPFARLESSRNRETGGVGLGLAIARSAVRRHGGDISFVNLEGGGLQTLVSLPFDTELPSPQPETATDVNASAA